MSTIPRCQGSPLLKAASQHPRARLLTHHFPAGLHDPHCAHPLVEKVSRSKNAAKISVSLQGPKSAAAQMLKFTNPRPPHTPQTPGRQGRKEAASRLRLSQGLAAGATFHTPGMPTPGGRGDFAPPYCLGVFSLRDRGLPQHPKKSLQPTAASLPLWASMGWTEKNPVGLPVQLDTQHAPRPLQTPPAFGARGCRPNVPGPGSRCAGCAVGSETPVRAPRPEASASKPGTRCAMPRPGVYSQARSELQGDEDRSVEKVRPRTLTHAVFLVLRRYPHGYQGRRGSRGYAIPAPLRRLHNNARLPKSEQLRRWSAADRAGCGSGQELRPGLPSGH
ncbi:hypothetical protein NN561_017467 [Cricetulus griseus]